MLGWLYRWVEKIWCEHTFKSYHVFDKKGIWCGERLRCTRCGDFKSLMHQRKENEDGTQ